MLAKYMKHSILEINIYLFLSHLVSFKYLNFFLSTTNLDKILKINFKRLTIAFFTLNKLNDL